ncbi:MAG: hypothetical protein SF187_19890 [Deltaproteobacteria bacterium]|nr:hypothetical protein [Deltaproteobacteria bacterium]
MKEPTNACATVAWARTLIEAGYRYPRSNKCLLALGLVASTMPALGDGAAYTRAERRARRKGCANAVVAGAQEAAALLSHACGRPKRPKAKR